MLRKYVKSNRILCGVNIPQNGVYTVTIFVPFEKKTPIGKLGVQNFQMGYYTYTGSALGKGSMSLEGRILRHLRKDKRKKWHIDFLTADKDVKVTCAMMVLTSEKLECGINQYLRDKMPGAAPVLGFGSSDCKKGCGGHLIYLGSGNGVVQNLVVAYNEKFGDKVIVVDFR